MGVRSLTRRWFAGSRSWLSLGWVCVAAGCLLATPAAAKLCGDDLDGVDVPCACGDVVASDLLLGDDPVAQGQPCAQDGLVVRAPDARRGLIIDLRGATLRGSGRGAGIRVVAGGRGGARVISSGGNALVSGFGDGVVARGADSLALIEDIVVSGSRRDGLRVTADDFEINRVEVHGAKRDGFGLGGRGFRIAETRAADSGRYGYFVMGQGGEIGRVGAGNTAERSGDAGFNIMGGGHVIAECTAAFGGKAGVHLQVLDLDLRGCRATDNGGDGIEGVGNHWRIGGNQALRNLGDGIAVRGVDLLDEGGNSGIDNGAAASTREPVQCAISGAPCAL